MTIYSFGQMKTISGDVNFRTSAEIKENKICMIPKGTTVAIVKDTIEYIGWTKISYNGRIGYVNNNYLKNSSKESKKNSYDKNTNDQVKYYINAKGEKVQSPTHYNSVPQGATAECNDGTYSFSKSRRGTCSHHGGVKRWL